MPDLAQKRKQKRASPAAKALPKLQRRGRGRKPAYVQTKLAMSTPGDKQEQQADQIAAQVSRSPRGAQGASSSRRVQRAAALPETEQGEQSLAPLGRQVDETAQPLLARQEEEEAQTKLFRQEEEEAAQTKLYREEEEEVAQTKLYRQPEEEEEEALQAKLFRQEEEEEEPLQAKLYRQEEEEEETMQTRLRRETQPDPEQDTQRQDAAGVPPEIEQRIDEQRGQGAALDDAVRAEMEEKIGSDFSKVIIHTDQAAAEMCDALSARAFTVGNDVFFAAGEYAPDTEAGRELLAHELAHVVQQNDTLATKLFREATDNAPSAKYGEKKTGYIEFASLEVPAETLGAFQGKAPIIRHKNYKRLKNDQAQVWRRDIEIEQASNKLKAIADRKLATGATPSRYYFEVPSRFAKPRANRPGGANTEFLIGSLEECARQASIPRWDKGGEPHRSRSGSYDVDHIVEQQFGAARATGDFSLRDGIHAMGNFWLLDANINQNAKTDKLKDAFLDSVTRFRNDHKEETYGGKTYQEWNSDALRKRLSLVFKTAHAGPAINASGNNVWERGDIKDGKHIDALKPDAGNQAHVFYRTIDDINNSVPAGQVLVFYSPTGGMKKRINPNRQRDYKGMLAPFELTKVANVESDDLLTFSVSIPANNKAGLKPRTLDKTIAIKSLDGSERVGTLPTAKFPLVMGLHKQARDSADDSGSPLANKSFSPISVTHWEVDPDKGMVIIGQILPSLPLLDSGIDFEIAGNDLTLSKTFNLEEIKVPKPLTVSECSLTVSGGTRGVAAEGQVDFGIEKIGRGYVRGKVGSDRRFGAEGAFDFDSKTFDPAKVTLAYVDNKFSGEGTIGIPSGKVPGIKSALITAKFEETGFNARGDAELDIPGVEKGTLIVSHSEQSGFSIGGSFNLSSDIPGIKSGSIAAELKEKPDGEGYAVKASGEAVPDVPGIDSKLKVEYDDGAIKIEGEGQYKKGMLDGRVKAGATNRTLDESGQPTGPPGNEIIFYGGGELTLGIAPWLEATVGVNFLPNADIEVKGEVGLPQSIEIFPRKEIKKDIFSIDIPIPIVPGIFAEVGGGLDARAGIGPGEIDQLKLGVEYNPNDEANTHVYGDAHLNVPADAGLRLSVHGGIGLGIPAASVSGGLEVGGELGIEGAAEAGVDIDWRPSTGLEIDAFGRLSAQPKFTFDVSGYVEVEALFFTIYENRWRLASFEYGSDMTFGVTFPMHYKEGEPFDISLSDVQFQVPDISPRKLLSDLVDKVA